MSNINKLKINNQPFDIFNANNFQAGTNIGIAEFDNGDIEISTLTQGVEYIVGTQQSSTNVWTGTSLDMQCLNSTLYVGKVIIYHLPYNGNTSPATLNLTLADNSTTGDVNVKYLSGTNVTNEFSAGYDIFMIYDGTQWKTSASGTAKRSLSIPFAKVDSTSTATAYTATVPGITELVDGTCVMLENGVVTSAAGFTININGLGAKPVFSNLTAATRDTTIFNVNYTMLFVYDSNRVVDGITGAWCCYRGYDANTNTIGYQLRSNSYSKAMTDITYRYRLLFSSADNSKWVPANTSTSTNATSSRAVCQTPINPFGEIVYYSTTASVAAGSRPSATNLWQQYTLTLGYSFNRTGAALTLTSWKPVYVKCAPQADGSAIMDSTTPYVQALPSTDDGKIYIFLGVAYNATSIELLMNHPVFYYKDGAIRQWSNAYIPAAVQSNWNETDTSSAAYIQNKPTIPDDSNLVHKTGDEPIGGQKTFSSTIVANGGIDVGQGTVSSEDSQDFSYITTGGGDTLQDALDAKGDKTLIVTVTKSGDTYTADKTYAEIRNAIEANTDVVVIGTFADEFFYLDYIEHHPNNNNTYIFKNIWYDNTLCSESLRFPSSGNIGYSENKIDISTKANLASPALTGTPTAPTATAGTNTTQIATTAFVQTAINALPDPMVFKGSLGTGGTITTLPTASNDNKGFTYKVITAGTYASQAAKVGDTFISDGTNWILIPSGDEPSGTVTSVKIETTAPLTIDDSSAITTSGTRTLGITMDSTPTANSSNPVTSGALKTALDAKANDSNVVHKGTSSSSQAESIYGVKTFESELHAYGGIDVYQGEITSTAAQDFSYITTNGGDTLQEALDSKANAIPIIDLTA